jgi:hypothetical protein
VASECTEFKYQDRQHIQWSSETYKILNGKPEGKRPLGMLRHRWKDNIKIHPKVVWCENLNWIHLTQDGIHWQVFVNRAMNLEFP